MTGSRPPAVAALLGAAHRHVMTSLASPVQRPIVAGPASPAVPRLIGAGIVATMGVVVFSIAIGNQVVGSSHVLIPAQAEAARHLVATTPILVGFGLLHIVLAVVLVRGRDLFRLAAVLVTGLISLATASSAAMVAAGVDPLSWSGPATPSTAGLGLLVIAALAYGAAAVSAGSGAVED